MRPQHRNSSQNKTPIREKYFLHGDPRLRELQNTSMKLVLKNATKNLLIANLTALQIANPHLLRALKELW
jgi:hypothetical protein